MYRRYVELFWAFFAALYSVLTLAAWLAGLGAALQGELLTASLFMGVVALAGALVVEAMHHVRQNP